MILLDPDLDHDPEPKATSVRHRSASAARKTSLPRRTPSARSLAIFLARAQAAVRLRGHVSVLLTTDKAIRSLNRQFRGLDKPTDVLSFPAAELVQDQKKNKEKSAGDLAISVPTARRQSTACGHSLATELKVLILHGLLHLAGYDHESDKGQMARRERRLRAQLDLPQGLIERASKSEGAVLKGHGFSRAVKSAKRIAALAAGGKQAAEKVLTHGRRPSKALKSLAKAQRP
jgi:probable rRNA maturation factor